MSKDIEGTPCDQWASLYLLDAPSDHQNTPSPSGSNATTTITSPCKSSSRASSRTPPVTVSHTTNTRSRPSLHQKALHGAVREVHGTQENAQTPSKKSDKTPHPNGKIHYDKVHQNDPEQCETDIKTISEDDKNEEEKEREEYDALNVNKNAFFGYHGFLRNNESSVLSGHPIKDTADDHSFNNRLIPNNSCSGDPMSQLVLSTGNADLEPLTHQMDGLLGNQTDRQIKRKLSLDSNASFPSEVSC